MGIEFLNFENTTLLQNKNKGVFARFYDKPIRTGNIKENGLPEFENRLYVEIKIKDERDVFDQPANMQHIARFPAEYNRYLHEKKEALNGTPLNQFAFLDLEKIEACKIRGIFSVEALAQLSDEVAQQLDLCEEKKSAKAFLDISKNNQNISAFLQKEKMYLEKIEELQKEIEALRAADNGAFEK